MATGTAEGAASTSDDKSQSLWNVLPSFDPAVDDPKEYADKVRFLHAICPAKDKSTLAPRLAMLMKGTAWAQIKAADAAKLTDPENGIKVLLQAIATWEEAAELQTYDKFERALYRVSQKADESTMSFVNRLNVAFQELGEVNVQDMKAFILLRQSALNPEDKKKVITLTRGKLEASQIEGAMRSLATKVLGGGTAEIKKKTYPVNFVEEDPEEIHVAADEDASVDEEVVLQALMEQGDEDALTIADFEDQLLDICQDSQELSLCFSAYSEARARLRDKIKGRGFWPPSKGSRGKYGRKGGGKGKGKFKRRTLADRIASSSCRICGEYGHWKWECPKRGSGGNQGNPPAASADVNYAVEIASGGNYDEVLSTVPKSGTPLKLTELLNQDSQDCPKPELSLEYTDNRPGVIGVNEEFIFMANGHNFEALDRYLTVATLEKRLQSVFHSREESRTDFRQSMNSILSASVGCPAIIDTGASKSVIGQRKTKALLESLPKWIQQKVHWGKSNTVFRFGNNGTLPSVGALFIPFGEKWMRLEVVGGNTPFLLSNAFLKATAADVCTTASVLRFTDTGIEVPLQTNPKGLFTVELAEVLKRVSPQRDCSVDRCEMITLTSDCGNSETSNSKQLQLSKSDCKREDVSATAAVSDESRRTSASQSQHRVFSAVSNVEDSRVSWPTNDDDRKAGCSSALSCRSKYGLHQSSATGCEATTGNQHAQGMGTVPSSRGKACQEDFPGSGESGSQVCHLHEEPHQPDLSMGQEFPRLCQSSGTPTLGVSVSSGESRGDADQCLIGVGSDDIRGSSRSDCTDSQAWSHQQEADGRGREHGTHEDGRQGRDRAAADGAAGSSAARSRSSTPESVNNNLKDGPKITAIESSRSNVDTTSTSSNTNEILQELEKVSNEISKTLDVMMTVDREVNAPRSRSSPNLQSEKSRLDVLEVYCEENSRLTQVALQMGLKVRRFTKEDGDLRTMEGQQALWRILTTQCPKHVWMSPECGPWGNFSRLNMCVAVPQHAKRFNNLEKNKGDI